ncbi:LOW QUALITY PROTEIN: hypothetical protein BC936DRAFT_143797 [Jimgerdemannia flammicorona]|uniref:N-acetyltransferase domain-containing protein n=1 Tax=Jimgerdemannia flammicorona TaxID=994334 RepID=A0A433DDD5_9FUNG|nr:LOW QUALITY PROTEIN: hypothetical protein BC936DRAFT_143797 [Jimgerdemannia flammicorona]
MRANENLILIGSKVILVPYKTDHVPQYHKWMKSPFLQEMTASEPLTLEEEFEMQRTWHTDDDSIRSVPCFSHAIEQFAGSDVFLLIETDTICSFPIRMHLHRAGATAKPRRRRAHKMIGDVNLFLNHPDDDRSFAEIEIMIAEEAYRRGGRGSEALKIMMGYALTRLDIATFQAKISYTNMPSVDLFTRGLGFTQISESEVFQERTFEWSLKVPEEGEKVKEVRDEVLRGWGQVVQRRWDE